ncbi:MULTISPECIES: hypothetical protein [unclassified Nonomuraea]|uniref:hypothetical protein n=1 Tax=unclassified Nonomuraea TaxID=2593643 RepID=UPI0035BEE25E
MTIALWIVQAVLAVMFGIAGVTKSTQPNDKLEPKLPWAANRSHAAWRDAPRASPILAHVTP